MGAQHAYVRHRRYGVGRVLAYEGGLFPRVRVRFEDGIDRTLDLDPAGVDADAPPPYADPAPMRGGEPALTLADGRALDPLPRTDPAAERVVFTLGYEGRPIDRVLALLRAYRIGLLADLRDHATSRMREYGRKRLAATLAEADIAYVHCREWGNPKLRGDASDARRGPHEALHRYTTHLAPRLVDAAAFVERVLPQRPAFFGFAAEPFHCHRSRFTAMVLPHCPSRPQVYHILPDEPA